MIDTTDLVYNTGFDTIKSHLLGWSLGASKGTETLVGEWSVWQGHKEPSASFPASEYDKKLAKVVDSY